MRNFDRAAKIFSTLAPSCAPFKFKFSLCLSAGSLLPQASVVEAVGNTRCSSDILVSEANNISLGQFRVRRSIDARVGLVVLGEPHLSLVVDAEVGQLRLRRHGDLAPDVRHLKGLLAQIPLVPVVVRLNVFLNKVGRRLKALVNHEWRRDAEQWMHAIASLQQRSKRRIREVILHLEQVDHFGHAAALLDNLLEIEVWIGNELFDGLLVSEHTVLVRLTVLKHAQVGLTGHQQALLHDVDQTETEEVKRDVHEGWC